MPCQGRGAASGPAPIEHNERTETTVSASREKKTRQGQTSQGPDERVQERQRKQKADRRSSILYAVVGVICVAAIAVTLVLNSGLIQRSMTAVTIQDTKYSAADLQYY